MAPKKRPRIDVQIDEEPAAKSRLYVDEDVANALRKVARAEKMELSPFVEQLLRYWLRAERPQWRWLEDHAEPGGPAKHGKR